MIATHGLTHLALSVQDPDRSLRFYAAVFGVREYVRDADTIQVLGPGRMMSSPSNDDRRRPVCAAASFTSASA
jgi:catechol 2,3-dioxygenase-like lactoylglutathione lyase family enzyme